MKISHWKFEFSSHNFLPQIDRRVDARIEKFHQNVEDQLRQQREAAQFKANPAKVLEKQPFIPEKADKPLTELSNFELHSDKRARERETYEQRRKHKEAELESQKRQVKVILSFRS